MSRTIIAVRGKNNSGKSATIRAAFGMLRQEARCVRPPSSRGEEIRAAILKLEGVRVGFVSLGDLAAILQKNFERLLDQGCDVIVCATRSYGGTADFVQSLEPDFSVVWIEKQRQPVANQDQDTHLTAEKIVQAIRQAVKAAQLVEA